MASGPGRSVQGISLLVVYVMVLGRCNVDKVRLVLVADARRPYTTALTMMPAGTEMRECYAEGVPHGCHGRGTGRVDRVLHG